MSRVVVQGPTTRVVVSMSAIVDTGGVTAHADLTGRDAAESHPIAAIDGLQTALDAKATTAALASHTGNTSNPHGVTPTQLGLVIGTHVQAYNAALTEWANKSRPTGDVLGTTDTQTITNKTLSTGTVISLGSDGTGDLYYRAAGGAFTRLPIGSTGYVLTVSGGLPAWVAASSGLSEPLTTPRFAGQTSIPAAAAANELKLFARLRHNLARLAYRDELGDYSQLWESILHPFVRSVCFGGNTAISKNISSTAGAGTSAVFVGGVRCRTFTTAATASTNQRWFPQESGISTGSGLGEGFVFEAFFALPDASYGTGATGAAFLLCVAEILSTSATTGARPSAGSGDGAFIHWSTSLGDTNFKAVVNDAGVQTVADTGLPMTAQNRYHVIIACPRGAGSTYFYIRNLDSGAEGTATIADVPVSTTMMEVMSIVTLDNVARNAQLLQFSTVCGGVL